MQNANDKIQIKRRAPNKMADTTIAVVLSTAILLLSKYRSMPDAALNTSESRFVIYAFCMSLPASSLNFMT